MKKTQHQKLLDLLSDGKWHCTSEMYGMFMADPRRRICDLKDRGHRLESRTCQQHGYHDGGSKEWRLVSTSTSLPAQEPERIVNIKQETVEQAPLFKI